MSIELNIYARDAMTDSLLARFVPQTMSAAEAEKALFGWVYKQPGMATLEDCKGMFQRIYEERGADDAMGLLQRFGIKHVKNLDLIRFEDFFKYASTALYYGASPLYGWTCKEDVLMPMWNRDRWLYHNTKTDRLWEVRGKEGKETDNPHVVDVSGEPEFEQRWVEQLKSKGKL